MDIKRNGSQPSATSAFITPGTPSPTTYLSACGIRGTERMRRATTWRPNREDRNRKRPLESGLCPVPTAGYERGEFNLR